MDPNQWLAVPNALDACAEDQRARGEKQHSHHLDEWEAGTVIAVRFRSWIYLFSSIEPLNTQQRHEK